MPNPLQLFPCALMTISPRVTLTGDPDASVQGLSSIPLADGAQVYCLENAKTFRLDKADGTTPPDGTTVIQPATGPGRWKVFGEAPPDTGCVKFATSSTGLYACAENFNTSASGNYSHAEGATSAAAGVAAHAEGDSTIALGDNSHAEGLSTQSHATSSHAEGNETQCFGVASHAEGTGTNSAAIASHAAGAFGQTVQAAGYARGGGGDFGIGGSQAGAVTLFCSVVQGPDSQNLLGSFNGLQGFACDDHHAYSLRINLIIGEDASPSTVRQSIWLDVLAHREGGTAVIDAQSTSGGADPGGLLATLTAGVSLTTLTFTVANASDKALRCVADVQWSEVYCGALP